MRREGGCRWVGRVMISSRGFEILQRKPFGIDANEAWQLEQVELLLALVQDHSLSLTKPGCLYTSPSLGCGTG